METDTIVTIVVLCFCYCVLAGITAAVIVSYEFANFKDKTETAIFLGAITAWPIVWFVFVCVFIMAIPLIFVAIYKNISKRIDAMEN